MELVFENLDPNKHDKEIVANLIYNSDKEMNTLVYGENAVEVIMNLLGIKQSYFLPEYTKCAILDNEIVGVVVYYPANIREQVDKIAGQGFMKAMGTWNFLKKMPVFMKMGKMLGGEIDDSGLYIHTICVDNSIRGKGIGTKIINYVNPDNKKVYLYVNAKNDSAIAFYIKNGFKERYRGKMKHKGKVYEELLMEKV